MAGSAHRLSLFAQSLDRAAFVAYFLGAVVPLVGLGFVVHRFALPSLPPDGPWSEALVGLTLSIAVLSGAAFFALRRVTWQTIARARTDNERLAALLEASSRLARSPHEGEVVATTVACAARLTGAHAVFFLASRKEGGAADETAGLALEASAGEAALFERVHDRVLELAERALAAGTPAVLGAGRGEALGVAVVPAEGLGALAALAAPDRPLAPADVDSLSTLVTLASVAARRAQLADAQRNFFVHVTDLLVAALDAHLDLQAGHSRRVAELSNRLGRELGLDETRRQRLHFAALLHDVGMLRVHTQRMSDPKVHRQHPGLGHRMLAPIQLWQDVAPIVLHHHEWYDGHGYPDGLVGEAIPLESRIIGLAEAFDSMTSSSSYKQPVEPAEAVRRIETGSGTQFDPAVVSAFLALVARHEVAGAD
jgi:putative nucleotidyltransferase with HDIG domain